MGNVNIRGIAGEDLTGICEVARVALPADAVTPDQFALKVFLDMNFDPSGVVVAEIDGRIVGFIVSYIRTHPVEDMPDDSEKCWITLFGVHPEYQNMGIGNALFDKVEQWFAENNKTTTLVGPYVPNWWTPGVDVNAYPSTVNWLQKRGYQEMLRPLSMDADLVKYRRPEWVNEKESALVSGGVSFVDFSLELIPSLFAFLKREFPGDWQRHVRYTVTKILNHEYLPSQIQLAVENGEVIGFAHHDGERFGPFGNAVLQRGRGVGAVLLCNALEAMRSSGLHNAFFLSTVDATARLYSQVGFRESRRYAMMKKNLV